MHSGNPSKTPSSPPRSWRIVHPRRRLHGPAACLRSRTPVRESEPPTRPTTAKSGNRGESIGELTNRHRVEGTPTVMVETGSGQHALATCVRHVVDVDPADHNRSVSLETAVTRSREPSTILLGISLVRNRRPVAGPSVHPSHTPVRWLTHHTQDCPQTARSRTGRFRIINKKHHLRPTANR